MTPATEKKVAEQTTRGVRWNLIALAAVLPLLFAILIWQLLELDPAGYCKLAAGGQPPGDHCFKLLMEGIKIRGWTIWLLIATVASFVLIVLVAAVRAIVSIVGPGGIGLNMNSGGRE